jgi:acyl carrier protein
MHDTDILARVTEIFREVLDEPALSLTEATSPADIPAWDSLRMVLLLATLEERFSVRFTTQEMDRIHRVGDILEMLRRGTCDP